MHEACLAPLRPAPPREVAETSLIYRIFAGTSRSQVGGFQLPQTLLRRWAFCVQTWLTCRGFEALWGQDEIIVLWFSLSGDGGVMVFLGALASDIVTIPAKAQSFCRGMLCTVDRASFQCPAQLPPSLAFK